MYIEGVVSVDEKSKLKSVPVSRCVDPIVSLWSQCELAMSKSQLAFRRGHDSLCIFFKAMA